MLTPNAELPVIIIGAGPVGLAAAAHLVERGVPFRMVERGHQVAASVRDWGHVPLFSPWRYCTDAAAVRLLESRGWQAPDPETFPTGATLADAYLEPLAHHPEIATRVSLGVEVQSVTRLGMSKSDSTRRHDTPFAVHIRDAHGHHETLLAAAVIDASGTYGHPNPMGAAGIPALGEASVAAQCWYGIPDVLGAQRARYAGKRIAVVGSGHSAFHVLLDLVALQDAAPTTRIVWIVRRQQEQLGQLYGGGAADDLPERGALGERVRAAVQAGVIEMVSGWRTDTVQLSADGVVIGAAGRALAAVDEVVVATGFRPDLTMTRELRLALDDVVEAPQLLAPHIDPNLHSCGTVPPHGVRELQHPEEGFFVVGMKSYGRAPTFLLLTGYEQVRSVVAALAGDWQAALTVSLDLPQTGVCSGPTDSACCGVSPLGMFDIALEPATSCCTPQIPLHTPVAERCC